MYHWFIHHLWILSGYTAEMGIWTETTWWPAKPKLVFIKPSGPVI